VVACRQRKEDGIVEHLWRWALLDVPGWIPAGDDGWQLCLRCGATDRTPELEARIPALCPGWVALEDTPGGEEVDREALRLTRLAAPWPECGLGPPNVRAE
jgi:hypothetical protein